MSSDGKQLATFWVGDLYLGIDVLAVQEIVRPQPMTRVPLAPDMIEGLINLRGQIVTGVDLRRRLGMAPRKANETGSTNEDVMNVVVETPEGAVSLLVDQIGDVVEVSPAEAAPAPASLEVGLRALIDGIYPLSDRLLLELNTARCLERAQV